MKKSAFEQIDGTYHRECDYLLPNLAPPENISVDIWGQRRRRYLKDHQKPIYTALLLSGKLILITDKILQNREKKWYTE